MKNPGASLFIFDQKMKEEKEYWTKKLSFDENDSSIRLDFPRRDTYSDNLCKVEINLTDELYGRLNALTGNGPFLLYTTLMAALKVCLHRYTGSRIIVVGSPSRKRDGQASQPANALAMLDEVHDALRGKELLLNVRNTLLEAYERQLYPYDRLLRDLGLSSTENRCPLFDVALVLDELHTELPKVKNDITLFFSRATDSLRGEAIFNASLLKRETVELFVEHYLQLLYALVTNPNSPIGDLDILSEAKRHEILVEWNDTAKDFDNSVTIHRAFEEQARRAPNACALAFEDRRMTYDELDRKSNRLAHYIQELGVEAEKLVGICLEPSLDLGVAILGVLKAGGAYLPLDPAYPKDRLEFMLNDTGVSVVLTSERLLDSLPGNNAKIVCLDSDSHLFDSHKESPVETNVTADNLAYVIYTSGSTGKPKGVMIQHRGVINLALAQREAFNVRSDSRVLQFASFNFDASVSEVFATLLAGATLYLGSRDSLMPGPSLLRLLREQAINIVTFPPSVLATLAPEELSDLKTVVAAGEPCPAEIVERWGAGRRFINAYGPTEVTVCTSLSNCQTAGEKPNIGRPISNIRVHILDNHLRPAGVGIPGEMYVGGVGVARGYLGAADLTAERFIPDPFGYSAGARLYKTGDRARYLESGSIDYLERVDNQVKIRGFRIETAEVSAALSEHEGLSWAVVVAREDEPGNKRLVAYVIAQDEEAPARNDLRQFLRNKLPEFMIPSAFVFLKEVPLTPNGKLDRKALPAPSYSVRDDEAGQETETPLLEILSGIFASVLGLEQVGLNDDFFELGGHSLLATQLISRVLDSFGVELPLVRLFESPSVAALAQEIETALRAERTAQAPPLTPVSRDRELPLSFAQQRLWFLNQLEPDIPFYHTSTAVKLSGPLSVRAMRRSFEEMIARHDLLRTTIKSVDGNSFQVIAPVERFRLPVIDLSSLNEPHRGAEVKRLVAEQSRRPFNLTQGPLLRVMLMRFTDEEHALALTMHHIISDGWSVGIITNEISALYEAFLLDGPSPLEKLPIQYCDFACWQRDWLQGDVLESQLSYWRQRLGGEIPELPLPVDRPRQLHQRFRGANESLVLSSELTAALKLLSRGEGVTLFMTMLAAFKTLLYRYTGQTDLMIGSPIANRTRVETERLIGFFVNTLVLRSDLSGNPSFRGLLKRVREVTLGAYMHQDVPFEKLVEELQPVRDMSLQPLIQVVFALQNAPIKGRELPGLTLSPIETEERSSVFDLIMNLWDSQHGLVASLDYNRDLFNASTIKQIIERYERLLESIAADPDIRLNDLNLLTDDERLLIEKPINIEELDKSFSFA